MACSSILFQGGEYGIVAALIPLKIVQTLRSSNSNLRIGRLSSNLRQKMSKKKGIKLLTLQQRTTVTTQRQLAVQLQKRREMEEPRLQKMALKRLEERNQNQLLSKKQLTLSILSIGKLSQKIAKFSNLKGILVS